MKTIAVFIAACAVSVAALAKLPAPAPSEEAKAKAAEAAAKAAHAGKKDGYFLCKSQDKAAAHYRRTAKAAAKPMAMPPCADPGPFVYKPAAPAAADSSKKKS